MVMPTEFKSITVSLQDVFSFSMSALDEATKLCRAEELKLTETSRLCKDILRSMKTRQQSGQQSQAETAPSVKHSDIPLKEREEVEVLEKVLKKALKIRSSCAVGLNYQENPCSSGSASKCPTVKDDERNPQKSSLLSSEVNGSRLRVGQLKSTAGHEDGATRQDLVKTGRTSQPPIKGKQSGMKPFFTQRSTGVPIKPFQMTSCSLESDRGMSINLSYSEEWTSHSDQELKTQSEASAPKEQWVPSPSLPLWQAQQDKKNKMWNKVLTRHSKPVPERDHYKKRLVSTFPIEWASVHIAEMEAELDVLTQLGLDLTRCYSAELKSYQLGWSPEPSTEKEYETLLMLTALENMMVQVIKEANHFKKDYQRKMAWWHAALCPLHSRVEWSDSEQPCLPPILAYSSKGELEDLHSLRLHVAQLKLEIHIYQAVCDTLINLISNEMSSSGHPSATVLRGVYSLIGEGGAQFPSLVLDIDSAQI